MSTNSSEPKRHPEHNHHAGTNQQRPQDTRQKSPKSSATSPAPETTSGVTDVPWSSSNTAAQSAESTASGSGSEQDPVQAAPVSPGDDPRPVSQLLALPPLTDAIKQVSKNPENPPAHGSYAVPVYNLDPSLTSDMSASVERTLPYHRLAFADGRSRWFTPLLEGLVALVVYVVLITLFTVVMMSIPLIIRADKTTDFGTYIRDDVLNDPLAMFFVFGSVALMFPAIRVARLIFGPRPWGLVHSVQRRVRWSLLLTALVVGAFCYGLLSLLTLMLDGFSSIGFHHKQPHEVAFWLNMVLLLVLVPLQCYAEELVFRGYLMQTIGRWLKNPAWAILLPAPFFMLAHGYDLWGQASIVVMAVLAGFLCWYTGGLEAAIGMHVMNNITTMAMGMFANTDPLQMQSSGTPTDFAMVLATEVLYTAAICWFTHSRGYLRTATFTVQDPKQSHAPVQFSPAQASQGHSPQSPEQPKQQGK